MSAYDPKRTSTKLGMAIALAGVMLGIQFAFALDTERSATVHVGERVGIWFGANYRQRCRTAGPPLFKLIAAPALGEVGTEEAPYVVPSGQRCAGNSYTGLRIWYKAGLTTGTDTFSYTLEFPHELSNPTPSKGPQPVSVTITIN